MDKDRFVDVGRMHAESALLQDCPVVYLSGAAADFREYTELPRRLPVDSAAAIVVITNVESVAEDLVLEMLARSTEISIEGGAPFCGLSVGTSARDVSRAKRKTSP